MIWTMAWLATAQVEVRAALGAEVSSDGHGILDAGIRSGSWSAQWFTDTLDLRWSPEGEHGRSWLGVRAVTFASQMVISPWRDGEPRPDLALTGLSAGPDLGTIRYTGKGWYAGARASAYRYQFAARSSETRAPIPDPRTVFDGKLILGLWRPTVDCKLELGGQGFDPLSPQIQLQARGRPDRDYTISWGIWAGWAEGQDFLTTTRVGGTNPYVVPFAGANWAEFWLEDYAVGRLGPSYATEKTTISAVADILMHPGGQPELGLALLAEEQLGPWRIEGHLSASPTLTRAAGVSRVGAFLLIERPWKPLREPP